ncbi:AarF/UbiB family protein [Bacteriovoracaceae bacterium]|nr:AarF/UbiB family protein [Bacteriovoracaceae bacterium]
MERESELHLETWPVRLKNIRQIMGVSQSKLANEFDVSPAAISYWEKGERPIPGPVRKLIQIYEEGYGVGENQFTKLNQSWLGRTFSTTKTLSSLAVTMAKNNTKSIMMTRDKAIHLKELSDQAMAIKFVESLGEMKGLVMKLGQTLSYIDHSLPENVRSILQVLQDRSKPMESHIIEQVIFEEFGKKPKDLFLDWDPQPISAASIGQVHRATLKSGEEVVVKVQYPNIDRALRADLMNTKMLGQVFTLFNFGGNHQDTIDEIRERFLEECNYINEAKNQNLFYNMFKEHPQIIIPKVFDKYSTMRVLTTKYYPGLRFRDFMQMASQQDKNKAGLIIYNCVHEAMVRHSLFNCDPHPGNYLFHNDKVVFLDFGCVKKFSDKFMLDLNESARAVFDNDRDKFKELNIKMGFVKNLEKFNYEYSFDWTRYMYTHMSCRKNYRFTKDYTRELYRRLIKDNPNLFHTSMPKDFIFVNRLWLGLHAIFAELDAENNWYEEVVKLEEGWGSDKKLFSN